MTRTRTVQLIVGFVLALALLGGVAWLGWRQTARMQEAAVWVAHTHEVQANRNLLLSLVLDIESNQRSYVLTGLPEFLDGFEKAVTRLPQQERRLEESTGDERQKAALSALKPLMAERIALARRTVELRQNSGAEAAAQEVATLKGKKLADEILARFARMDARGNELLDERSAAARREAGTTARLTLTGTALSFALLITVFALTLRENRRRLRAEAEVDRFFTLSLDLLCIASADGYFKRVSPAFTETLGWSAKELLARPFLDFVHPDDRAATLAEVERQVVAGEKVFQFENRYAHKDGSWRVLSWKSVPQPDGRMFATARDVTERTQAEEEIRKLNDELEQRVRERTAESEAQHRHHELLLTSAGEGLYGLDLDGRVTFMNPAGAQVLGYSVAELLGQPMHAKCHHTHADGRPFPREDCPIYAAKRDGHVHHDSDDVMWRKDGSAVAVEYTSTPMRDEEGQLSGAIVVFRDLTERRRVQAELQLERGKLSAAFENMETGVVFSNAQGGDIVMNAAALRMHGFASQDEMHTHIGDYAAEWELQDATGRVLPFAEWPLNRAVRGDQFRDWEVHLHNLKSDHAWDCSYTSVPVRQEAGEVSLLVMTLADITERKQTEEALREREAQLRKAQRIGQMGSWQLDLVANRLAWSDEIFQIFEIDPQQFGASYEAFLEAIHPDDREMVNQAYAQSVRSRTPYEIEHRLRMPDGRIRFVQERCETVYDATGKPLRSLGTVQDITERKRAEAAVREAEWRYRTVFEQSPVSILLVDPATGGPVEFNDQAPRQLGYTREEFARLRISDYEAVEKPEETKARVERILKGEHHNFETRHRTKQGDLRNVLVTVEAMELGDRALLHVVFHDVTEIRRAEAEIRKLNAELEQRVQERTRQLAEANQELAAFNSTMVGREQRMIEMKEEVNALCRELGREPQYPPVWKEVG